jgi:hypothetical protein
MNSTGVDPNSSYVFSNNENSILQTINGNGINQLAALSQNSVTQTSTTGSADPTSTTAVPSQTNMSQDHHLSTGQIVGISVGSGVGFLLFIGIAILFLFVLPKRRRTRKQGGMSDKERN